MWGRLKVCTAEDCQWVFVDRSKPGTGKWCSMKACGNRAKNKTYRERSKSMG
nr:CGNR zinc finger domain-containing protein [Paenibacillus sp. ISL-20]